MASSFTTNKTIEKPANNDDVNTWDVPVNGNSDIIDACLGGTTNLNAVGASGNVVLTAAQYRPPLIIINGLLTANVVYQLPANVGGFWSIFNNTTGAFTVTFDVVGAGASVVLSQGFRTQVTSDGTNIALATTASTGVTSFSGGATGLTPAVATSGAVVLAGTLAVANGGTGATTATGTGSVVLSASPTFTGAPLAPTPTVGDSSTKVATTAFVATSFAPLASPTFTGVPLTTTPATADRSTKVASTAFVGNVLASFAPLASPALTGTPTAPTASANDNSNTVATTAFVKGALAQTQTIGPFSYQSGTFGSTSCPFTVARAEVQVTCVSADSFYTVGDVIFQPPYVGSPGGTSGSTGIMVRQNGSTVSWTVGASFVLLNPFNGQATNMTQAHFQYSIICYSQ